MSVIHAILGVLSWSPSTGYDIKKELERGGAGLVWQASFGSIYPQLEDLLAGGLIQVLESKSGGREQKTYDLTREGWLKLQRWLASAPRYPIPMRDELLLRMMFWGTGRPGDRATLMAHLLRRKQQSQDLMTDLEQWLSNGVSAIDEYGFLIYEYLASRLKAETEWLDHVISQLGQPERPPVQDPQHLFSRSLERRARALEADVGSTAPMKEEGVKESDLH